MSYSLEAIYQNSTWAISNNTSALAKLQEQAASGQVINRPSDNPSDANRILSLRADSRTMEQYLNSISEVLSILDLSSSVIQGISGELADAMASLTSVLSGTMNEQMRVTLAEDINNALEQIVSLANTSRLGQYLFGGANSSVAPYAVNRDANGDISRVTYQGSYEDRKVEVSSGVETSALFVGDELFRADEASSPVFYGNTGTAAGTGTSSVRGDIMLTVTGSPGAYVLSIDEGTTTVTVDGSETNAAVVHGTTGEVLYVDATGITSTGSEPIRVPGTYDMFNILICARDMLRNVDNLSDEQWNTMMDATIGSLDLVEEKLVRAFPIVGGRIGTLTNLQSSLENMKLNTEEEVSRKQDADITQVAVDLARYEVLYEMSLSVAAQMFSLSLMDFIR
jgi:flagellar hook-associated protein 3 FlgL